MSEPEQKKRLGWQFSLRSLLLLMLLVAAFFAGYTAAMQRVRLVEVQLQAERRKAQLAEQRAHEALLVAEHQARFRVLETKRKKATAKALEEQADLAAPVENEPDAKPPPIEELKLP